MNMDTEIATGYCDNIHSRHASEGEEWQNLKSQFVTSSWGGRRTLPYAFTEQGVAKNRERILYL